MGKIRATYPSSEDHTQELKEKYDTAALFLWRHCIHPQELRKMDQAAQELFGWYDICISVNDQMTDERKRKIEYLESRNDTLVKGNRALWARIRELEADDDEETAEAYRDVVCLRYRGRVYSYRRPASRR